MKLKIIFLVVICFLNGYSQNQKYIVKDSLTNEVIEFVGINFLNNVGVYTGSNGEFYADPSRTPKIIISHLSYEEKIVQLYKSDNIIYLTPKVINLNEIVIENKKLKKQFIDINTSNKNTKNFSGFGTYGYQLAVLIKPIDTLKNYYLDQISLPINVDKLWMSINNMKEVPNALVRINFSINSNNKPSDSLFNYLEYILLNKKTYKEGFVYHKMKTRISVPKEGLFCILTLLGETDLKGNLIVEKPTYKSYNLGKEIIFFKYLPIQIPLQKENEEQNSFSRSYFNKEDNAYGNVTPLIAVPSSLTSKERASYIREKSEELGRFSVPIKYTLYYYD
ncbi:hypothetical protein CHU92_00925 [Flavobacterium cyanobacteriorum]|uniref:Carboxypeptidase-like regulatory domain-containing protein n=1 Tax=Flavobacterium cyanobacteriorum TaxID=2022802 RepID=A0A256A2Q7_9FLAO|nr:hypothetical protein [Flavobacterium cyanobacteriorum]OYQ47921.1 hypothetical protein CHU92_00925 [Flavobacterium cyanobacteriorum]